MKAHFMIGVTALGFVLSNYGAYALSAWSDYFSKNSQLRLQNTTDIIHADIASHPARMGLSPATDAVRPLLESTCNEAVMRKRDWGNSLSVQRLEQTRYLLSPYLMARSARGCLCAISFDTAFAAGSRLLFNLNGFALRSTRGAQ